MLHRDVGVPEYTLPTFSGAAITLLCYGYFICVVKFEI